jgi:hypothetical protein
MAQPSIPKSPVSKARQVLASCLLAALLVQIGMFFVGLLVPVRRIESLWGKSFEDRQMAVCQPARVLTQLADQFPIDAKIYMTDPQLLLHWNSVYFFYPRLVTVTMTNRGYRTHEAYAAWNERPTDDWLISNGFTHVLSYKNNALQIRPIQPAAHPGNDASR